MSNRETTLRSGPAATDDPWSVVLLVASFGLGGAERVMITLANGLAARGHPTTVVALSAAGLLRDSLHPAVHVHDLATPRARDAARPLLRWLRAERPDVILASVIHLNLLACLLRPLLPRRTRIVIREASSHVSMIEGRDTRWSRFVHRALYPRADLVLATSAEMLTTLRAALPVATGLLPNPVMIGSLRSMATPPVRHPGAGRRFVFVGRLVAVKAVDELIRALHDGGVAQDHLTIIGEGPERAALEALAAERGVGARITFLGAVPEPAAHVAGADALVLPSRSEGMPNVVLEALAVGTQVIATSDLEVLGELRSSAPAGAVRIVDRPRLAEALIGTEATPPARAPRPSLLPDRYGADIVVTALEDLIDGVLVGRTHPRRSTP